MKRVLVVDDDELIRTALRVILEKAGLTVHLAKNGLEGMKEYRRKPVDLVFVDIFMPAMDGFEFIRELRQAEQRVPVIVMSGMKVQPPLAFGATKAPDYLRMARALGAVEALQKPFSRDELWRAIDTSLHGAGNAPSSIVADTGRQRSAAEPRYA